MKHFISVIILVHLCYVHARSQCTIETPGGFSFVNSSCQIDLSWNEVYDAESYLIRYKASYDVVYSFLESPVNSVSITGLNRNVKYSISVAAVCADSSITDYSANLSIRTQRGTIPQNIQVVSVTSTAASLAWETPCAYNKFNIQWRKAGTGPWSTFNNILTNSHTLVGLLPGTTYQFKIRTKEGGGSVSVYSDIQTFTTSLPSIPAYPTSPNIIVYMLDDARYDVFELNGGPEWFNTPNINRIAEEGVNFELATVPTPVCAPARAMMYTGLLPHKNGCVANGTLFNAALPKVSEIFTDSGYYTGLIGKYGNGFGPAIGFNWYATSENDEYINPPYDYNGVDTNFTGNILDVYPQLALEFLNSVPEGQPFMLYYFDRAPHDNATPRLEDSDLYIGDTIPFPANFSKYLENYPSYYYNSGYNCKMDSSELVAFIKNRYRVLHAVDENIGQLFSWLEANNQLDSTIIIFTSDNGYLYGEHKMLKKGFALEESFRIPLFIRYPSWFEPGTVISDQFASLIDIPTTMLEIAEIDNTFGFDGKSLRALGNSEITEQYALHQIGYNPLVPSSRGLRTMEYLYTYTFCSDTVYSVEQLFDLTLDPGQNINLAYNPSYELLIDSLKLIMDSIRFVHGDTIAEPLANCYLAAPLMRYINPELGNAGELNNILLNLYPVPAIDKLTCNYTVTSGDSYLLLYDMEGVELLHQKLDVHQTTIQVDVSALPSGIYFASIHSGNNWVTRKFTVMD